MPLDDDNPKKWRMREHTEIKHEILRKYFISWVRVVSSRNKHLHFFDGFAGRGYYKEGEEGSPLLIMDAADRNSDHFDEVFCTFVELDDNNYEDLENAIEAKKSEIETDKITVNTANEQFENFVGDLIEELEDDNIIPSLFFIDPFGYNSIPFDVVSEIANIQESGVEMFITFMVRDIRRFLEDEGHEESITRILGTEEWKEVRGSDNKESKILQIYERQLMQKAGIEYVWPFEMKMPNRRETVYHLIHATNHFKGFKIMKEVMYNSGADDKFAYLGPEHYAYDDEQSTLFESTDANDDRIIELAEYLSNQLEGEKISFYNVMKKTYTETDLIEKHYRDAIYHLEHQHRATIHNQPKKGGTKNGLNHNDVVEFNREYGNLNNWSD